MIPQALGIAAMAFPSPEPKTSISSAGMIPQALEIAALASLSPEPKIRLERDEQFEDLMARQQKAFEFWVDATPENKKEAHVRYKKAVARTDRFIEMGAGAATAPHPRERRPRARHPRRGQPEKSRIDELRRAKKAEGATAAHEPSVPEEEQEAEEALAPEERAEKADARDEILHEPGGGVIMQVLDSNQLLDMLAFSWEEIRNVLRHQQAEYTLLKYRMQVEGTYL